MKKNLADAQVSSARAFVQGGPAALLANGLNVNSLRTNTLLRHEEWLELDQAVVLVARQRLNGIADLRAAGLIHPLGGLGTILSAYEKQGDMTDANINMDGITPGEEDRVDYAMVSVPVPITHKDFRISIRTLEASRRLGDGLDTTQAQVAAWKVSYALENMLFNGSSIKVNGNVIYGYTTHGDRNQVSVSDFGTISNIYPAWQNMMAALNSDHFYGPYGGYVASTQYSQMMSVYTDGSGDSALARILKNIPAIQFIKPSDVLTDGSAVLVQLTSDVVDLAVAQDIVNVQWSEAGGMLEKFKVMAAMAPRIKSDANSNCGVAHATGA